MEKKLVLFLALLLILPLFSAVPPVTTVDEFPDGYLITEQQQGTLIYNQDFTYNFFLYNSSNGVQIDDTSTVCTFLLSNISGNILFIENATYNDFYLGYWEVTLAGGNFSYIGEYPYGVHCENGNLGGALSGTFYAGYSGRILDEGEAILYIPLFMVMFFLFFATVYGIGMLPASNATDPEDKIIKISYLKYLRSTLWFVLWMILMGIFYISSNLSFAYSPDLMVANFFFMLYKVSFGLTPLLIVLWFVWIFVQIIDDKKLKQMWERGMFPQKI